MADIEEAFEHDEKYEVGKNVLELANEKMKNLSSLQKAKNVIMDASVAAKENVVKKDGMIIHARSADDYLEIWDAFCEKEAAEFCEYMGYDTSEIAKIGMIKFIDIMDWRSPDDVGSWRTDRLKVIPCVHCGNNFAIFQEFGLCPECTNLYDIDALKKVILDVAEEKGGEFEKQAGFDAETAQVAYFVYDEEIRDLFLKEKKE